MKNKAVEQFLAIALCALLLCGCGAGEAEEGAETRSSVSETAVEAAPVPTPAKTPAPTPTPEPAPTEVSLVMVGDVLLHTRFAESGKLEDGSYDFTPLFANVREKIESADIALVNQEVIIGGSELGISGYPAFNAPYELGDALVEAGFDVILHATNHALDKREQGLMNCLNFWEENYPQTAVLGIYGNEEDSREIYVCEQEGIRIAILNYTYSTNGVPMPEGMPYAVDMLEESQVVADLQAAEKLADFTVVCPHWGTEYTLQQTKNQEQWAELFAENGADLILGTHPHVIEPIRWMMRDAEGNWVQTAEKPESGEGVLVYYSLGNFANWTSGTGTGVANRMVGGMAEITLTKDEEKGVFISNWGVEPTVCHVEQGFGGVTVYPLEEYTEEMSLRNEIVNQDGTFSLEYCRELAETVFGDGADKEQSEE